MSFRNLRSSDDVVEYAASLDARWPERSQVIRHIRRQVNALPFSKAHVVELGSGPGLLARHLLSELPDIVYTGIDNSEPLQTFARSELAPFAERVELIRADLNADSWPGHLHGDVQAVVSMQSLHDLGDEAQVNRIYGLARSLIVPGGAIPECRPGCAGGPTQSQQPRTPQPAASSAAAQIPRLRTYILQPGGRRIRLLYRVCLILGYSPPARVAILSCTITTNSPTGRSFCRVLSRLRSETVSVSISRSPTTSM